jgi:hypothetical protein
MPRSCSKSIPIADLPEAAITYDARRTRSSMARAGSKTGRQKTAVKVGVGNGTKIQSSKASHKVAPPS